MKRKTVKHPLKGTEEEVVKEITTHLRPLTHISLPERLYLTSRTLRHIDERISKPQKGKEWQKPYREIGKQRLEEILEKPKNVLLDNTRKALLYCMDTEAYKVCVVIGLESGYIYTVEVLENPQNERYLPLYP